MLAKEKMDGADDELALGEKEKCLVLLVEQDTLNNITNLYLRQTYVLLFFCQKVHSSRLKSS